VKVLLITLIYTLVGCSGCRAVIGARGAESADVALEPAEWALCKLPTGGALERRYNLFTHPSGKKARGWVGLCHSTNETSPAPRRKKT